MAIVEVATWLASSRNFEEGRDLLLKVGAAHGVSEAKLQQVRTVANALTRAIVLKELQRIHNELHAQPAPVPVAERESRRYHDLGKTTGYPDNLVALDVEVRRNYQQMNLLRGQLRILSEGEELKAIALQIVTLYREIRKGLSYLDYFARTGMEMPGTTEVATRPQGQVDQLIFWLKALKSYPAYISKDRKSQDSDIKAKVMERQKVLDEINEFLKTHGTIQ